MKALDFVIRLVIPASLLMLLWVIVEEADLTSHGNAAERILLAQEGFSSPYSSEEYGVKSESTDTSGSTSTTNSKLYEVNDPYADRQWALNRMQAPLLWQITRGNPEILVACLDTGIDQNHEDIAAMVVAEVNFTDSPSPYDIHGHGTHIAGIIIAGSNNGIGIAGLAPESRLMNVKVADDDGLCQASVIAEGILWAVNNGASVINISLEFEEPLLELEDAVNYAWSQGAIVVVAAGNAGSSLPTYPACYENAVAVAALRQDDTLAPLSNYGDWVDLAAPGLDIYSTLPGNSYGYKSGTSFAAAYVSGLAALLFDIVNDTNNNGRLNDEVRAALEDGCFNISTGGVGDGRADAAGSLAELSYTP